MTNEEIATKAAELKVASDKFLQSVAANCAARNTNRELWREREGDYYADSLFVTEGGGIGMNVGGLVIVLPLRMWHKLAVHSTYLNIPPNGESSE
jgi:hypothetical protein